jgi:hypothetical protein
MANKAVPSKVSSIGAWRREVMWLAPERNFDAMRVIDFTK